MTAYERLTKPRKASGRVAGFNILRGIVFAVLQSFAALATDGWLSLACWCMAAYNVVLLVVTVTGLVLIAVETMNREAAR